VVFVGGRAVMESESSYIDSRSPFRDVVCATLSNSIRTEFACKHTSSTSMLCFVKVQANQLGFSLQLMRSKFS
jgi:hypothetical protein